MKTNTQFVTWTETSVTLSASSSGGSYYTYTLPMSLKVVGRDGEKITVKTDEEKDFSRTAEIVGRNGDLVVIDWGHEWGCAAASGYFTCRDNGDVLVIEDASFAANDNAETFYSWDRHGQPRFVSRRMVGSIAGQDLGFNLPAWVSSFVEHAYCMGENPLSILRNLFPEIIWACNGSFHHMELQVGQKVVGFSTQGHGVESFEVMETRGEAVSV